MQRPVLFLCLAAALITLGGCAFMSDEDRDFYGRGWVKPSELDQPIPHHSTAAPLPATGDGSAPLSTTSDPAWDVPGDHPR